MYRIRLALLLLLALPLGPVEARLDEGRGEQPAVAGRPAVLLRPALVDPDPVVREMIAGVNLAAVTSYNGALSGEWPVIIAGRPYTLETRFTESGEPILNATRYVGQHLAGLGMKVRYHQWQESSPPNVIGEITGRSGQPIYLLTAHLDATSERPYEDAPGADDNASGSTAVLIAADILSRYRWNCTLRFALWTGEEQGLLGSAAYAAEAAAGGEPIAGVLNLDMIGYNGDPVPIVDLHARSEISGSVPIANLFAGVVEAYQLDLVPNLLVDNILGNYSDNASFWAQEYPAILAIEDYDDFTPYYHSTGDTLSTLDVDYFAEVVRAAVATFAHLSACYEASSDGTGILEGRVTSETGAGLEGALVTMTQEGGTIAAQTTAGGAYSLTVPAATYDVTATARAHASATVRGVAVYEGEPTTLDFVLSQADHLLYLPFLRATVTRIP